MPARIPLLIALAAALVAPLAASAQTELVAFRAPAAASDTAPLTPYLGTYAAEGGSVELVEVRGALRLLATGAPVAAALADLAPTDAAMDTRAAPLLEAWIGGDSAPLAASVAPSRQLEAASDFDASRAAMVRRLGDMSHGDVIATFRQTNGHRATLARVSFERGSEWISLVWNEDGALVTLRRGLSPVQLSTARHIARDTFESADTRLTFRRDATGRIHELAVGSAFVATR